jgi:hypothetical protein
MEQNDYKKLKYASFEALLAMPPLHGELDELFRDCTLPLKIKSIQVPLESISETRLITAECATCHQRIRFYAEFINVLSTGYQDIKK